MVLMLTFQQPHPSVFYYLKSYEDDTSYNETATLLLRAAISYLLNPFYSKILVNQSVDFVLHVDCIKVVKLRLKIDLCKWNCKRYFQKCLILE